MTGPGTGGAAADDVDAAGAALERDDLTQDDIADYLRRTRNWGRWGADDERGALNLIDDAKRIRAARLVRTGRSISLSRPVPVQPAPNNPTPALVYPTRFDGPRSGASFDFQGMSYHGSAATHIDALCHAWTADGMWGGRDPDVMVTMGGARFGSIDRWQDGILTRGVLLDVVAHRRTPFVTADEPVHARELEEIARRQGVTIEPGDAIAIHSGREAYEREHGAWGGPGDRPGLHADCLRFFRRSDAAVLLWDMFDVRPSPFGNGFGTHAAISAYGVAVIDSALLEPLSEACRTLESFEFMLGVAPPVVIGGTGGLVNPIATF